MSGKERSSESTAAKSHLSLREKAKPLSTAGGKGTDLDGAKRVRGVMLVVEVTEAMVAAVTGLVDVTVVVMVDVAGMLGTDGAEGQVVVVEVDAAIGVQVFCDLAGEVR